MLQRASSFFFNTTRGEVASPYFKSHCLFRQGQRTKFGTASEFYGWFDKIRKIDIDLSPELILADWRTFKLDPWTPVETTCDFSCLQKLDCYRDIRRQIAEFLMRRPCLFRLLSRRR